MAAYTMTQADETIFNTKVKPKVPKIPNIQNSIMGTSPTATPTTTSNTSNLFNAIVKPSTMISGTTSPTAPTTPPPQYDFTKTPAQNATVGNTLGYSGVGTNNTPTTQTQPTVNPLEEIIKRQTAEIEQLKTNYTSDIASKDKAYSDVLEAKRAAVRAAIQKAQGKFQQQIQDAPEQFQDKRNQVVIDESRDLQAIRKSLANLGYNPDSKLTRDERQALTVNSRNQVRQLELAEAQIIKQAQNSIDQLEAQGGIDDASAIAEIEQQKMQALDNLRANFNSQLQNYQSSIGNNIKGLMEWERNLANDETDRAYKASTLEATNQKNLYEYNKDMATNQYNQEKLSAENVKNIKEQIYKNYGFYPSDQQLQMMQMSDEGMGNQDVVDLINKNGGNIAAAMNEAKNAGRDDLIPYLEASRFNKVATQGMTEYGGQYNLPPSWYTANMEKQGKGYEVMDKMYSANIKRSQSDVADQLAELGLQKAANEVYNGNLKNAMDEINLAALPEEKRLGIQTELTRIADMQNAMKNRDINTSTSAYNAETSRMNADTSKARLSMDKDTKSTSGLEKEADKWLKAYEDSLKDETSPNGTPLDYYYYNSPESTQRADAFRGLNDWLVNSGASDIERVKLLTKKGFGNFLNKG